MKKEVRIAHYRVNEDKQGGCKVMAKPIKSWARKRLTTYLAEENIDFLQALADMSGVPIGRIMDQALDEFLGHLDKARKAVTPPVKLEHFQEAVDKLKAGEE